MAHTPFSTLAALATALETIPGRIEMAQRIAACLERLAPQEVAPAVRLLLGQVFPEHSGRALNVSWAAVAGLLDELTAASLDERRAIGSQAVDGGEYVRLLLERARRDPQRPPPCGLVEVYQTLEAVAAVTGPGARQRKTALLRDLLERMAPLEAKLLVKNIFGEVRHGAGEGVVLDAIARASGMEIAHLRRAHMLWGDLGDLAAAALGPDPDRLLHAQVRLFRPLKPMLAQSAESMEEVYDLLGGALALEYKLDGARVQIHKDGDQVRIYSRQLADVTASLPDVAAALQAWTGAQRAVLEGEVIALDPAGRPLPFQELMRRFRRRHQVAQMVREIPVRLYLFDALYLDGQALIDLPYAGRWQRLAQVAAPLDLVPRLVPTSVDAGVRFAMQAADAGHEGVMAKALSSPYTPGVRGRGWLKLKHVVSLDLAIVAADWGYGRRHGWLSNYHLAARDEATGEFAVVGKTFKGLTDAEFEAMTAQLLALETHRTPGTVYVRPQVVVEVVFNEIQLSPRYSSGLALRFARIARLRDDKGPADIDTLTAVRALYERQFQTKGRRESGESRRPGNR